jgi:sugar/nucleoside kinase (ribokinase family)
MEDVIDPTGAGDTFAGALAGYLTKVGDLSPGAFRRAIMVGTAAASYSVEAVGTAKLGRLSADDISDRLRLLRDLTHVDHDAI